MNQNNSLKACYHRGEDMKINTSTIVVCLFISGVISLIDKDVHQFEYALTFVITMYVYQWLSNHSH